MRPQNNAEVMYFKKKKFFFWPQALRGHLGPLETPIIRKNPICQCLCNILFKMLRGVKIELWGWGFFHLTRKKVYFFLVSSLLSWVYKFLSY